MPLEATAASTIPGPRALQRHGVQASLSLRPLLPHTAGCSDALWEAQTGRNVLATVRPVTAIARVECHGWGCVCSRGAVGPQRERPMKLASCIIGCGQFARTFVQAL